MSHLTLFNFEQVFEMPAADFLSYLKYLREKARRDEIEARKIAAKYKR